VLGERAFSGELNFITGELVVESSNVSEVDPYRREIDVTSGYQASHVYSHDWKLYIVVRWWLRISVLYCNAVRSRTQQIVEAH
jgi:hypothetical protein